MNKILSTLAEIFGPLALVILVVVLVSGIRAAILKFRGLSDDLGSKERQELMHRSRPYRRACMKLRRALSGAPDPRPVLLRWFQNEFLADLKTILSIMNPRNCDYALTLIDPKDGTTILRIRKLKDSPPDVRIPTALVIAGLVLLTGLFFLGLVIHHY